MPDAGVLATILLIAGLFLLALELMIPSFGIIGILSAICLLVAAWSAWQAWWGTHPGFFWTYFGFWLVGIPSVIGGTFFLLQNTSLGDHVVLRGQENMAPALSEEEQQEFTALVGLTATAASALMPGGLILVGRERHHAVSQGMVIHAGDVVEIVGTSGARLIVRPAEDDDRTSPTAPENNSSSDHPSEPELLADTHVQPEPTADAEGSLDFEIPEG